MNEEIITCDIQLYGPAESAFLRPFAVRPDAEALTDVVRMPGETAWASATALDAQTATREACAQHDMKTAQGVLAIITLSPDSSIVASIKAALTAIYRKTPAAEARAFAVAHDDALNGQVRVEILLTGL